MEPYTLTSEDLRALKSATSWMSAHAEWNDGALATSYLRGTARDVADDDYTVARIELPSYLEFGAALIRRNPTVRAYGSCSSPTVNDEWLTILQILRPGDRLALAWSANGWRNGHLKTAGLNADHVRLRIDRGEGKRARRFYLPFDHCVCPDNSARMFTNGAHGPLTNVDGDEQY